MLHMPTAPRPLPPLGPSVKPTKITITAPTSTTPTNQGYSSRRRHHHRCFGRLPTTPMKKRKKNSRISLGTRQIITNGRLRHKYNSINIFQPCPYPFLFALSRSSSMFVEGSAPNHGTFDTRGKSDRLVFGRGHTQGEIGGQSENGDNVNCRGSGC